MSKFKQYLESVQEEKYKYDEFVDFKQIGKKVTGSVNKLKNVFLKEKPIVKQPMATEQKTQEIKNNTKEDYKYEKYEKELNSLYTSIRSKFNIYKNELESDVKNKTMKNTLTLNSSRVSETIENMNLKMGKSTIELSRILRTILDKDNVLDFFKIEDIQRSFEDSSAEYNYKEFLLFLKKLEKIQLIRDTNIELKTTKLSSGKDALQITKKN